MRLIPACAGGILLGTMAVGAHGNLLINGGLETTRTPNRFNLVWANTGNGSSVLHGWRVTQGTVDVVPNSYFQSSQGNFSVDLVGTPRLGEISQRVKTIAGVQYVLTFDFSVNPEDLTGEASSTKRLRVSAAGVSQTYTGTTGTRTNTDMQYTQETFTFRATSQSTTITLAGLLSTGLPPGITATKARCGPVVDNLDLEVGGSTQPPEPGTLGILGLGGLLMMRRRRRA